MDLVRVKVNFVFVSSVYNDNRTGVYNIIKETRIHMLSASSDRVVLIICYEVIT
jgi:hypothetical protein